jgi:GDP-4-dehydro-6-deoxy-D-mannose reductase
LITGGAGFTGSFLVEGYLRNGWAVHATYRTALPENSAEASFHQIDLVDGAKTRDLIYRIRPDTILHLAAQSSVARSWMNPVGTYTDNVISQYHVLEAASDLVPMPRVLVVGSADEYGLGGGAGPPLTERQELLPITPYGLSKVAQDLMGYQYFQSKQVPVLRVRPFLQIGPRRADRFFSGSFARQVAEVSLGLRAPVVEVGDVDLVRDMTDVRDVADAFMLAVEVGEAGDVYNVCSGEPRTIRQLLEVMMSETRVEAEISEQGTRRRSGEPRAIVGDPSKFESATGWKRSISFEESARDAVEYWRDRLQKRTAVGETV